MAKCQCKCKAQAKRLMRRNEGDWPADLGSVEALQSVIELVMVAPDNTALQPALGDRINDTEAITE